MPHNMANLSLDTNIEVTYVDKASYLFAMLTMVLLVAAAVMAFAGMMTSWTFGSKKPEWRCRHHQLKHHYLGRSQMKGILPLCQTSLPPRDKNACCVDSVAAHAAHCWSCLPDQLIGELLLYLQPADQGCA
jgi:hypothetical protein